MATFKAQCPHCEHELNVELTVTTTRNDDGAVAVSFHLDDTKLTEVINRHLAEAMDAMAGALDNARG